MSDSIFVTEETKTSGKRSENNNKFRKGTKYTKGAKKWRENARVYIWGENRNKLLKLLLPSILIKSLPQFIKNVPKNNSFVKQINTFKSERTFETPCIRKVP